MSDWDPIVVPVIPDFAQFASLLAAGIADAMEAAVGAVTTGTGEMADAVASAGNDITSNLADVIAPAFEGAMASAVAEVEASSGTMDEILSGATQDMGDELGSLADVASAAADQTAATWVDASGRMRDENNQLVAAIVAAFEEIADKAKGTGDEVKEGVGGGVLGVADIIKGAALGNLLADGIESGVELALNALQSIASYLPNLGSEIQGAFNTIRVATGDTGPALDSLKDSFNNIATKTPAGLDKVGQAVSVLNQRLGLTGEPLEKVALGMLRISGLTGTDLDTNLQSITGAFKNFNITAENQSAELDRLFRVYQATGAPMGTLTSSMSSLGPIAQSMGLSFDQTAAIVGRLNNVGLDAGSIQMGLTKIMKKATEDHVAFGTELTNVFSGIKNGLIGQEQAMDLFGPRGVKLFELVKNGTLDYQGLTAAIEAGGDTLQQAATDTSTWQAQLGILSNQIAVVLEPIATTVFTLITDAVRGLRPVIVDVVGALADLFTPAWQGLLVTLKPVWDLLSRFKDGVTAFISTFDSATDIVTNLAGAVSNFVAVLTGSSETGAQVGEWVQGIIDKAQALWDQLQPVRDFLVDMFDKIQKAIGDFVAQNPTAVLVGFGAAIATIVVPAVAALVGILGGLALTAAGAVAGFLAVPVAIGALVTAFIAAYNNIQGFHDAVDGIVSFIRDTAVTVFDKLSAAWNALWPQLVSGAQAAADVWNSSIKPAVQGLLEALQPVITWMIDHWQILASIFVTVATGGIAPLAMGLVWLWNNSAQFRDIIQSLMDRLGPFVSTMIDIAGHVIGDVINVITGLVNILTGLFSLDWDKIKEGFGKVFGALADIGEQMLRGLGNIIVTIGPTIRDLLLQLVSNIPQWLGNLGGILVDLIEDALSGLGRGFLSLLTNIPQWLGDLGAILVDVFENAFGFVVTGAKTILSGVWNWIIGLPQHFLDGLSQSLSFVLTFLYNAFAWVVAHGPDIISGLWGFFQGLPGRLLEALGDLGVWLYDHALVPAFHWIVDNGPGLIEGLLKFWRDLPGKLLGALGSLGETIFGFLKSAFQWVVDKAPDLITGLIDFFTGLPGKIFGAITSGLASAGGAIADLAKGLYNSIAGFVNEHLLDPIRNFTVNIGPYSATPFTFLPELAKLADGAIVDDATTAMIGEAGREVVIPLERPNRALELANRSGLTDMIQSQGGGGGTVIHLNIPVSVQAHPGMSPQDAAEIGKAVGDGAAPEIARVLEIRAMVAAS